MQKDLIQSIYKFYPKNVSSFTTEYYETKEFKELRQAISVRGTHWQLFIEELANYFGDDYVRDRSDAEPSNRCIIFINKDNLLFEFVLHISLLANAYTYYVKKHLVDRNAIYTREIDIQINEIFVEIEKEGKIILLTLKKYYDYPLFAECNYNLIIPDVSTKNKELGQVTLFNALFSDADL